MLFFYAKRMAQICFVVNTNMLFAEEQAEFDPQTVRPGSRYSHVQEVQERLNFLRCDIITLELHINFYGKKITNL